ncbi:FMRFamide receptor [Fasciolopsis buskii]|uniref:FMRFamide receptor n=1 Tax=Fasciolopsis buskii TaxID=27845 RepID=A0A8E0S6L5_9TREM|nr:FMRFamide receptor [Fasciolopsis buski]
MSIGDNLTAAEVEHLVQIHRTVVTICLKGLFAPICIVGIVANSLNIVVLTRAWMSSSTNIYLTAVAVIDLLYLVLSLLFSLWFHPQMQVYETFARATTLIRPSANLCSNTTTWLTLCFTMERYVAVSYPILGRRICTQRRARCAVVCIVIFSTVVTLPDYLTYNVIRPVSNSSQAYQIVTSPIYDTLDQIGYSYINQAVFVFIPMILLIAFNTLLIRSVLRASKGRKSLAQSASALSAKVQSKSKACQKVSNVQYTDVQSDDRPEPNPVLVKSALEASMKTTLELASSITQSFGQSTGSTVGGRKGFSTSTRARKSMLGEQHRITLMLITIVIAFVLLQLPSTVPFIGNSLIKTAANSRNSKWEMYMRIYIPISNLLLILSGAMNFVFYSLFSAKFRRTCCMLLQRCNCLPDRSRSTRFGVRSYSAAHCTGAAVTATAVTGHGSVASKQVAESFKLPSENSKPSGSCYMSETQLKATSKIPCDSAVTTMSKQLVDR